MPLEFDNKNRLKLVERPAEASVTGICDFHVHVGERIGGYQLRDGFAELDAIAKKRGIAAIGAFVTEEVGAPLTTKLQRMQNDAEKNFSGHVHWHLTPVSATPKEVIPLLEDGCDLKFYTTYKSAGLYSSYDCIADWMKGLSDLKTRILVHCEDNDLIEQFTNANPFHKPFEHTRRRPEEAEVRAVARILDLAVYHQHPVHIVHVSSPESAVLIHDAKKDFPLITCETAPHYLLYNEDLLKGTNAHRWLCSPPLRSEQSRGQLVELLQDGYFDVVASDHCAFTDGDKDRYKDIPEKVPMGIPGLSSLFTSLYSNLVQRGTISLERLLDLCCRKPAQLMGIRAKEEFSLEMLTGVKQPDESDRPDEWM